jgi:NitT/TauT family transport system substrate-binding protein
MQRRELITLGATVIASASVPRWAAAQTPEKTKVILAVGGKNLFYYLPLTIAEQLGYFKAEGLDVTIVDFAGGAKALQAVVGGSADVVSGAFEHTINMQFKGQPMRAFVLQGATPQIVLGVNPKTHAQLQNHCGSQRQKGGGVGTWQFDQRDGQLPARQSRSETQRRQHRWRRYGQWRSRCHALRAD